MTDTLPAAESTPIDRAAMAARIISGELTTDEAGSLWGEIADRPTILALKSHGLFKDFARSCMDATMEIVGKGEPAERAALVDLARGHTTGAANQFETLISQATARKTALLMTKAALFAFITPRVAVNAMTRIVALEPDNSATLWSLALLLEATGELDGAESNLQTLLAIETRAGEHANAAQTLAALGRIAEARDDLAGAQASLERALELYEKAGAQADVAKTLVKLGEIAVELENSDAAEAFYNRALECGKAMGNIEVEAEALGGIGLVHMERTGGTAAATTAFERAIRLWETAGNETGQARMLLVLGITLKAHGDKARAQVEWQRAATLFEKLGLEDDLRDVREQMAEDEPPKPRPPPPPSTEPLNSLEFFWERIAFGFVTEDVATAMWRYITEAARAARADAAPHDDVSRTLVDFKTAVLDINERADAHERVALSMLVPGDTDDAAKRYEAVVAQAGDQTNWKLWLKGALFAPTAPAIAREAWERLLKLMPDLHDVRYTLGMVLERLGDRQGAEVAYQGVLTGVGVEKRTQAQAVDRLGDMARNRRDYDGATHFFQRSLQLYRELDDTHAVYMTLHVLGWLARTRGDLVLADSFLWQALEVAGQRTDGDGVLNTLTLISSVAEKRGDFKVAEDAVRRAIGLHEQFDNKPAAAAGYQRLGELSLKRDDLEAAYTHLDQAREISQKNGDDAGTARAFGSLGALRIREKDYDHADWYFKTAAALYEKLGDQGNSAGMIEKLGWTFVLRGNSDEAGSQFGRALARYANVGMHEAATALRKQMEEIAKL